MSFNNCKTFGKYHSTETIINWCKLQYQKGKSWFSISTGRRYKSWGATRRKSMDDGED